ncbi:hypothetical protein SynNOUM97013_01033 [Synechococcus sp. NOUM97013]|nr:hypothetical protein SynNOUM97013_01033 [Synechococcus sp. NOUM97013]
MKWEVYSFKLGRPTVIVGLHADNCQEESLVFHCFSCLDSWCASSDRAESCRDWI